MNIPAKINNGDSYIWDDNSTSDNLGDPVTSTDWTLKYHLRGPTSLDLTAAAESSGWRTTLSTTDSAALKVGVYYWQAIVTKSGAQITLGSGQIQVLQSLQGTFKNYDGRTPAEQRLAEVRTAIAALGSGGVKSYAIGTRSVTKLDLSELMMLEGKYAAEVAQEKAAANVAAGLGNPRKAFVRFT